VLFLRARGNNEQLVGIEGAGKEDAEEKKKIVAKEEAESLMIFLITAAQGREKGQEKRQNEGTESGRGGRTGQRRLLHLAVSTPYSSELARPSTTHVQLRRRRRRRRRRRHRRCRRGFSRKKY
jgi:hypothetical protein